MSNRYRDASLSPEERTEDLLAQMTLDEKLAQLQCHFFAHGDLQKDTRYGIGQVSTLEFRQALSLKEASGIQREIQETVMKNSRFGIPAVFHMEGLCGALVQDATSFPAGIGRGASFDPALEEKISEIVSRQERALGITQILAPCWISTGNRAWAGKAKPTARIPRWQQPWAAPTPAASRSRVMASAGLNRLPSIIWGFISRRAAFMARSAVFPKGCCGRSTACPSRRPSRRKTCGV